MTRAGLLAVAAAAVALTVAPPPGEPVVPRVVARVLGIAQDGGLPHLGCARECCVAARRDPARAARVASLGLRVEPPGDGAPRIFIIDATPDFRSQVDRALAPRTFADRPPGLPVDGILLTHAHIGHYTGLMYLGRESMAATAVPVYATRRMGEFLSTNGPWKRLVKGKHIELRTIEPGRPFDLAPGLSAEPLRVPHREEESDVVGFLVKGPSRRLLYIPDVDDWSRWDRDIASLVASVEIAVLDATFYSPGELGLRSLEEVPHPLVPSTMDRLEPLVKKGHRVIFIHLNHTNPALRRSSPEYLEIVRRGFEVAAEGLELPL
ncbi:MAG TPA: MBL fold metallo-hydrolase [Candidatus Polarisedimenticolia bacterium]